MTLQEKVAALPEITPKIVRDNFTFDEFKFEILEQTTKEPNYDKLFTIFNEAQIMLGTSPYNIINERIIFKSLFLHLAFDLDINIINALLCIFPFIKLDNELNKILQDVDMYKYMEDAYWQHRKNIEVNLSKVLEEIGQLDLSEQMKDFKGGVEKLQGLTK